MKLRRVMRWVVSIQVIVAAVGGYIGWQSGQMADALHGTSFAAINQQAAAQLVTVFFLAPAVILGTALFFTVPIWLLTEIVAWREIRRRAAADVVRRSADFGPDWRQSRRA